MELPLLLDPLPVKSTLQGSLSVELDPETLYTVLASRHQLCSLARLETFRAVFFGGKNCYDEEGCGLTREEMAIAYMEGREVDGFVSPFVALDALPRTGLCRSCRSEIEKGVVRGREVAWEKLPHMFGLGSWKSVLGEEQEGSQL